MTSPAEQARVLLAMILCGAALGAGYDALWLLRKAVLRGGIARGVLDVCFGCVCAMGIAGTAVLLRVEALRGFTLAGAAAGMALWRGSIGTMLRSVYGRVRLLGIKMAKKNGK